MTAFSVRFLGCKVSYMDSDALRERLLAAGHQEADASEIALVNTCCVTREAVAKSRQAVAKAARAHAKVLVTGCAANLEGAFEGMPENVVVLAGEDAHSPERLLALMGRHKGGSKGGGLPRGGSIVHRSASLLRNRENVRFGELSTVTRSDAPGFEPTRRVRAFVQIQDGCSFGCSYCIVPLVRGPSRSRTAGEVLAEIRQRVGQGHKEVVLSGINLGCFRKLAALVREAGETLGLERLRLSSIEINHIDPELIAAIRETPAACRHLHIPLQSGDDGVLRAMKRHYDAATFLRRVESLDDFNLTTDAMVGFPGEDEAAFGRTLDVIERADITKVHVFPYSPRPGTATAASDDVPASVKRERAAHLREYSKNSCIRAWSGKIGMEEEILIDRPGRGYARDYTPWLVQGPPGGVVRARAERVSEEGIAGVEVQA